MKNHTKQQLQLQLILVKQSPLRVDGTPEVPSLAAAASTAPPSVDATKSPYGPAVLRANHGVSQITPQEKSKVVPTAMCTLVQLVSGTLMLS